MWYLHSAKEFLTGKQGGKLKLKTVKYRKQMLKVFEKRLGTPTCDDESDSYHSLLRFEVLPEIK